MYPFKKCREIAGLTQKEAAISMKVKPPSVVEWEKGKSNPTIENLIKMSHLYHMPVDVLLGLDESPQQEGKNRITTTESKMLSDFRSLNKQGQEFILQALHAVCSSDIYKKSGHISSVENAAD